MKVKLILTIFLLLIITTVGQTNDDMNIIQKQITIDKTASGKLEYTYRVIKDIELRGINGESNWFFNVEKGMKVSSFKLNLFIRMNELIRSDISNLAVYMNGLPVKSMKIKTEEDQLLNYWMVDIPANLVTEGYNELKVRTYSRITGNPCEDDKNIANWVIIDKNTNYQIVYDKILSDFNISDFPSPFVGIYADDSSGLGVIIPDEYTDNEISAALTLISHLKDYIFAYTVPSTLVTTGDPSVLKFDSLIYIGNLKDIPEDLKSSINDNQIKNTRNNVYIFKSIMVSKHKPVLMIVSDNDKLLIKAVKALKNSDIKEQMVGNKIVLKQDLDVQIKEEEQDDYIFLKELGINGIEVKGSNHQVANIGLKIPFNQMLANEAHVNLRVRYSDNLDYEKSMVSVYINGIPIGSQRLERDERELHIMDFYIPTSLRANNYFDVRIIFELIPAGIIDCERYLSSVPWAYIMEDTNYFFPRRERELKLLSSLPYPFVRNGDLDLTTIVLPDYPTPEDLWIAGEIAELTGIGVKKNKGTINAITGAMFGERYYNNNLIIVGTPQRNSVIKSINKNLWFQYNDQFNTVLSNEKIELLPETANSAAFLELKSSPFNSDKGMMTITSLNEVSLVKAIKYFEDNKRGFLVGDAALIYKNSDLKTFRFQKEESKRPVIGTTNITRGMRNYLTVAGVLLLYLILSLIFYKAKNRN